jgi:hypothetical protein
LFTPEALYGAVVREIRDRHKMSRDKFMALAGLPGRSAARLSNIEKKDSWKPGDREKVAALLNQLEPNFDPRYHASAVTTPVIAPVSVNGDGPTIYLAFADDDPDDDLVDVVAASPERVELPIIEVIEDDDPEFVDVLAEEVREFPLTEVTANDTTTYATREEYVPQLVADDLYAVSNSELQTWKRCRRKWWLAYYRRLALQTEVFVGARAIGDRVHRALAQWYVPDGTPRVDPRDALERVIVEDWTRIATTGRERNIDEDQLTVLAAEFAQSTNLERAMIEGYVQWLEETGSDADLRIVASETALEAPVTVTVDGEERAAKLIGKLDVRARRTTDDVRLFLDHKTVGDLKGPAVTLPQNEQVLQYMLLEFLNTPEGETRCDGALYNMLRRTKRTARAQPPFYDRVEVHHNRYELESYQRRALAATGEIMRAVDRLNAGQHHFVAAYPSPKSDCRWDCSFFAVCNLFDDGSPGVEDMVNMLYHQVDPRARYNEERGRET